MTLLAKTLMILGLSIFFVGLLAMFAPKLPFIGKLPGDLLIRRGNFTFYAPIMTSLILSAILTLLLNLFSRK